MTENRKASQLTTLAAQIKICTLCPLCETRILAVPGDGKQNAKIMIIAEAPGRKEDESGHAFVGSAGNFLDHILEKTGFKREDFFITGIVKCRPPKNRPPNRVEIETCTSNYLFKQIEALNPTLIMLLGLVAAKRLLSVKSISESRGRVIEREGRKFIVGYHPAVRFYRNQLSEKVAEDFALLKVELKKIETARVKNFSA